MIYPDLDKMWIEEMADAMMESGFDATFVEESMREFTDSFILEEEDDNVQRKIAEMIAEGELSPNQLADQILSLLAEKMPLRVEGKPLRIEEYPGKIREMYEYISDRTCEDCPSEGCKTASECDAGKAIAYKGDRLELAEVER